jgi:hypothetical protein
MHLLEEAITNENFQKILFSCNSSHNFTPKRNELRYHCCGCTTAVFHRALLLAFCHSRSKDRAVFISSAGILAPQG